MRVGPISVLSSSMLLGSTFWAVVGAPDGVLGSGADLVQVLPTVHRPRAALGRVR